MLARETKKEKAIICFCFLSQPEAQRMSSMIKSQTLKVGKKKENVATKTFIFKIIKETEQLLLIS